MVLPDSYGISRVPQYSGFASFHFLFGYRALTFYGALFHTLRLKSASLLMRPTTPMHTCIGLGCSAFARHYLRNHSCFLLLGVLRCFSSPSLPLSHLCIQCAVTCSSQVGFPHSDIDGSPRAYRSPSHFVVCHVLLRLLAPRHPPCALISLSSLVCSLSSCHGSCIALVDPSGIEPLTSCLQGRRSPS